MVKLTPSILSISLGFLLILVGFSGVVPLGVTGYFEVDDDAPTLVNMYVFDYDSLYPSPSMNVQFKSGDRIGIDGDEFYLRFIISDKRGVDSVQLFVDGDETEIRNCVSSDVITTPYVIVGCKSKGFDIEGSYWESNAIASGQHSFYLIMKDNSGNQRQTGSMSIVTESSDSNPPSIGSVWIVPFEAQPAILGGGLVAEKTKSIEIFHDESIIVDLGLEASYGFIVEASDTSGISQNSRITINGQSLGDRWGYSGAEWYVNADNGGSNWTPVATDVGSGSKQDIKISVVDNRGNVSIFRSEITQLGITVDSATVYINDQEVAPNKNPIVKNPINLKIVVDDSVSNFFSGMTYELRGYDEDTQSWVCCVVAGAGIEQTDNLTVWKTTLPNLDDGKYFLEVKGFHDGGVIVLASMNILNNVGDEGFDTGFFIGGFGMVMVMFGLVLRSREGKFW